MTTNNNKLAMLLALTWTAALLLGVTNAKQVVAPHPAGLTDAQKTIVDTWQQKTMDDFEALRDLYTPDAYIVLCNDPAPCLKGNFDDVMVKLFDKLEIFESTWDFTAITDPNYLGVKWHSFIRTKQGCNALMYGTAQFELNAEGKIVRHVGFSGNGHGVAACLEAEEESQGFVANEV